MNPVEKWIAEMRNQADNAAMISIPADELSYILGYALKTTVLLEKLKLIDGQTRTLPDGGKADLLWEAWYQTLWMLDDLLEGFYDSGGGFPAYLHVLRNEFGNLMGGIHARLLRLDGAALGENPQSMHRLGWQLYAAVLLRLSMERDGKGSQKKVAGKIAKALEAGGMKPPGRTDKGYTARAVIDWLRDAENGQTGFFAERYRELLSKANKHGPHTQSLEELLTKLTEMIKLGTFLPHDGSLR
jgi:hypothetical protein